MPDPAYAPGYYQPAAYTAPATPGYEPSSAVPAANASWDNYSLLEQRLNALEQAAQDKKAESGSSSWKPTQKWSGRIHADYWGFPGNDPGSNYFERGNTDLDIQDRFLFRRLRLGLAGDIGEVMEYKIEFDFAAPNALAMKDVYIGWNELPVLQTVLVGSQKRPYGLDHLNSSRYNVFMERPYVVEAFNQDARRVGLCSYGKSDDLAYNWRYGAYLSTDIQPTGEYLAVDAPGNHNYQAELAGRFANTIWYDESSDGRGYAHWAVSGSLADTDGSAEARSTARFRTRPEARTTSRWLDTGTIEGANAYQLLGLEGVVNVGPAQCVGELMHVWVQRTGDASEVDLYGGYMYLSYFLTGEHIPWERESGTIGRVKPFENFFLVERCHGGTGHGLGAWQVALRYSYGDFTDDNILGGVGSAVTFGLNWWWTPYSRLQFNYIYGDIDERSLRNISGTGLPAAAGPIGLGAGHYNVIGARFAVDF
jgi:phosphate-selective porin OprO/OprP